MARPLRIEYAGALYHVTARGDGREEIGDYFGLHYLRISRIMKELEKAGGKT